MKPPALGVGLTYTPGLEAVLERDAALIDVIEVEPQLLWRRSRSPHRSFEVNQASLDWLSGYPRRKLVLTAPFLVLPVGIAIYQHGIAAPGTAWLGFAYVSLISQLTGFFLWYQGLAMGGVVRVSQVQFLQPFMTLAIAAIMLGEKVTPAMLGVAVFIVATVAIGKRMPIAAAKTAQAIEIIRIEP